MRSIVYEITAFGLWIGSVYLFARALGFLEGHDYVAGIAVLAVGFLVVRTGFELSKLAVALRRER